MGAMPVKRAQAQTEDLYDEMKKIFKIQNDNEFAHKIAQK